VAVTLAPAPALEDVHARLPGIPPRVIFTLRTFLFQQRD
jgi:hypothetical protein